ncbi:MAG TPA: hypothetical protein VJ804_03455 [Acidimicrobiales bacterium]|nr:hypothetical protein [Acidimicrobiales bacterium]
MVDPTTPDDAVGAPRRARFRDAISRLADRSTSADLVRWMLVPGSLCVLLGIVAIVLGWYGAANTAREIEQMPYLISGGVLGLALVLLGGLLLVATFWVAILRKLQQEANDRADASVADLEERVTTLESARRGRRAG